MSERLQINLNRTFREMMETYNEYNELLTNHPPPWSFKIKIDMKAHLQLLKQSHDFILQSLDKWEDIAKKIKDERQRNIEYGLLDTWRDDESHRKMIKELSKTILKGEEFLEMDDDNTSITSGSTQGTNKTMVTASVPPINLPKFNGDYLKWTPFWQRFENAVHNGPYAKIEKLISLLGYLEGRALEEVDGFTVAEENYDTIVNTLKNRFGNKTLIVLELQEKLRGLETAKPDPESVRSTVNLICNMCRQLENLGVDIENESTKLDIINKLPHREKQELKWWLISESEKATVSELMEKMKRMALKAELAPIRETKTSINFHPRNTRFHSSNTYSNLQPRNTRFDSNPVSPNPQQFNNRFDSNRKSSNFEPLNNRFASTTPIEKQNNDKMKCSLCDGKHWASNCTKYTTPDEKLKQLRSKNYCTKCSRSNHETKNCVSKIACRICNGNHFDYLCKEVRGSNKSSAFISVEKRQGFLMTKDITVINPITKETADTVVIFDSGSQQSYVSDRIIQQLKLEKVSKEKINVIGFGAKASSYMASLVKLQIKTEECHKEIFANSTKSIAETVPVLYAKSYDSSDIKTVYKTPEILIGMDYFFDIINSFEKCSDNLFIINSNVGKIFCKKTPKQNKVMVTSFANTSSPYFDKKGNYFKNTNYAVMNGIQNSSNNKKAPRKSQIKNCIKTLDEKERKLFSKNGKEIIRSETAVIVVNDNNEESAKAQKLYDDGLLSNTKLTTDSDVIFDYPMCQPWKPWKSKKIIDQLKLDMAQQQKDESINKLQCQQKYVTPPSSVTKVKGVTSKTSNGCGGERLVNNYKKSNKLLNSKKIWYNNGLREQKDLLKDFESSIKVTGELNYQHEISNKLIQLNTKITEPFIARQDLKRLHT